MNDQWSDWSLCRRSKREARLGSNYTQTLSSWARNKTMGPVRDWHRPHHLWAKIKKIKTVQCSGIFVELICILSSSSYSHMSGRHWTACDAFDAWFCFSWLCRDRLRSACCQQPVLMFNPPWWCPVSSFRSPQVLCGLVWVGGSSDKQFCGILGCT